MKWHAFGRIEDGMSQTAIIGPTEKEPPEIVELGEVCTYLIGFHGPMAYLRSYDYEPDDEEHDALTMQMEAHA